MHGGEANMRVRLFSINTLTAVLAVFLLTAVLEEVRAQDIFGRISGTVTDAQGGVVADVKITIINQETKLARPLSTDDKGFYVAPDLPAGLYSVTAETTGFKTVTKASNDLRAGARLTVDLRLEVGGISEKVEVTATAETVNTTSGEIARTIDLAQVQHMALNERNYAQLISLIPGAVLTTFDQTALTTGMSTTGSSVNGLRAA